MGRRVKENPLQPEFRWEWDEPLYEEEPPFFPEPTCDNERLLNMQHDLIVSGDRAAWVGLWVLVEKIACKMVRKRLREEGRRSDDDTVHDMAQDAAAYLLNRYDYYRQHYAEEYMIRTSYISAIHDAVRHACDDVTEAEKLVRYVDDDFFDVWTEEEQA